MNEKNLLPKLFTFFVVVFFTTNYMFAEMRSSITQYGITWTFNGQYECGQFVTGDWWVVGPVTINSVSPAPTTGRNGSCLNPTPWGQGYDDRKGYKTDDQITYPCTLQADQSLVSSVSKPEGASTQNWGIMQSQAVLTVVSSAQPANGFRPSYCGTYKRYFTTNEVQMQLLPAVPAPASKPAASDIEPYLSMPRIDHVNNWEMQWACAEDNWTNGPEADNDYPCYGRGISKLTSLAALYITLDVTDKTDIVYDLIQMGIDNYGVLRAGGAWRADGGHMNARKFPIVLAAMLLNDADMLQVGVDYPQKFGPDGQTYYGVQGVALWGNNCSDPTQFYTCNDGKKDCRDPEGLVDGCTTYIDNQTSRTWPGQALAAMMMDAQGVWNHDAYFDYLDRWMAGDVHSILSRGGHAFVNDMWDTYRSQCPIVAGQIIDPTGVSIDQTSISLEEGATSSLSATIAPSDATYKSVTWSSGNEAVATVNSTGIVSAVAEGTCIITATTVNDLTATCSVTVTSAGSNVALGQTVTVSAYQDDANGSYPGSNLVDGNTDDASRWSTSGFPQWAEIDLGSQFDISRIDVFPYQDRPYQYIIEASPDGTNYTTIIDRSGNTEAADALIDNVASAGTRYVKITVTGVNGGISSWVSLTEVNVYSGSVISIPPTGISLSQTTLTLDPGSSSDLDATVTPSDATNKSVTWSSDNTSVATVNSAGFVTAIAEGSAVITATTIEGGLTANCNVTVNAPPAGLMNLPNNSNRFTINDITWPTNIGDAEVCLWNDDKVAAISINIDDNKEADHSWWLSMANQYPIFTFTWFINTSNGNVNWPTWQALIDAGHEVQAHDNILDGDPYLLSIPEVGGDVGHCDINYASDQFYHDTYANYNTILNAGLTNNVVSTMAYPCGTSKASVIDDIYIGCRGVYGVMNKANAISYLNINSRSAVNDVHDVQVLLDPNETLYNNVYYRGLSSNHYHQVDTDTKKQETETFLAAIYAERDKLWAGGFTEIVRYGQERDSHTLTITNVSSNEISFNLSDQMIDTFYDFPLTVKIRIDNAWSSVMATQNGTPVEASIVENGGNKYALVKAVPDRGEVTVTPGGNVYYCSPTGSMSNSGTSPSTPWANLETVASQKTFADGSIIYLMTGNHGNPVITESNTANVTITKYASDSPVITSIDFNGAAYWTLKDVEVSANGAAFPNPNVPLEHPVYPLADNALIYITGCDNIVIENCEINSIDDNSVWTTANDWNYKAWNGIMIGGSNITVTDCHIKNVNFGTTGGGTNFIYRNNVVENFGGDGMQTGADYAKIENNTFMNCYDTNGNHDDLIQFYAGTGNNYGVEVRGNKFINYTDPNQPFRGEAQGIAFFDGMHTGFIIENNLVVTSHWHGLTILGATNCTIVNNTVIEIDQEGSGPCWIQIAAAKDGTLSTGNVCSNNLCTDLANDANIGTVENNIEISWSDYDSYFVDFANLDLHLIASSPAIDAGVATSAPAIDIDGITRPQNSGVDVGAYEYIGSMIPVTGISVMPTSASLIEDETIDLDETIEPASATNQTVTWSSGNTAIATVDANGIVTAVNPGTATITVASNENPAITATSTITVSSYGENLALNKPITVSGYQDDTFGTYPGTNLVDGDVSDAARWSVSGLTQWAEIDLEASVELSEVKLYPFQNRAYQYIIEGSNDGSTYTTLVDRSANTESADVLADNVTGTYRYIKLTTNGLSGSTSSYVSLAELKVYGVEVVPVNNPPTIDPVADVNVLDNAGTQTVNLTGIGDGDGNTQTISIIASSSNSAIVNNVNVSYASGNTTGTLTFNPVSAGTSTITVTVSDDGGTANGGIDTKEISFIVTVDPSCPGITGVSLNCSPDTLSIAQTYQYVEVVEASCAPDKTVTWSSSNSAVAVIDANGLLTAVGPGTATITVTTNDGGYTASCNIIVADDPGPVISNLALNKPITVSAYQDDAYGYKPGENLVDGDVSDDARWSASGLSQWAEIDLGQDYVLTSINLYPYQDRAYQYIIEAMPEGGSYSTIVDRSSNTEGADILSDDVSGTARYIKLTISGLSGSTSTWTSLSELEVMGYELTDVAVDGVSVAPISLDLDAGETYDLTEIVSPANATDKSVFWSSNNTSIATVDGNGLVTAIDAGSANITVTTNDGGFTAACNVTVSIPVTGVTISDATLDIGEGATYDLDATVLPTEASNQNVTWSSGNTSIATVDADGIVSAIVEGTVNITVATIDGGYTATCIVTVIAQTTRTESIIASNDDKEIRSNGSAQWVGQTYHRVGGAGSGYDGCSVHPFQLPALNAGESIISANFSIYQEKISNSPAGHVDLYGIPYRSSSIVDAVNDYWQGTYGTDPANTPIQDDFATLSTPNGIVTIDATGAENLADYINAQYAAGAQAGDYIFIRLNPDVADVANYNYWSFFSANSSTKPVLDLEIGTNSVPVDGVSVSPASLDLIAGQTSDLTETVSPADATDNSVSWSSSNTAVAIVDANGVVSALNGGQSTITVTTTDGGFTASCIVNVTVPVTGVSVSPASLALNAGQSSSLTETVSPANASDNSVSWSSSNTVVASVDGNGLVTANGNGTATITVTTSDGGFNATSTVTVTTAVTGVTISDATLDLIEGGSSDLDANVLPATASNPSVTWSSDNTSAAIVDANGLVSAVTEGTANITVTTTDGGFAATCVVTVSAPQIRNESIIGSGDDMEIRSNGGSQWYAYAEHRVGGAGSGYDGCSVHPFQLPVLATNEVITSASFSVYLNGISNSPGGHVDLTGISYRSSSSVNVTGDYWQGAYGTDPNSTPLQDDFATLSTPSGYIITDATGGLNLVDYINAQYAAGAQGGDYIFIRLNPDIADVNNYNYWKFASANSSNKPVLDLEITGGASKSISAKKTQAGVNTAALVIWPNPLNGNDAFSILVEGYGKNAGLELRLIDITGKLISVKKIHADNNGTSTLTLPTGTLDKGVYIIAISDGNTQIQKKLIVN